MDKKIQILIVEDEMIIASKLALYLNKLGYEVAGIMIRGRDAITHIEGSVPDLVLMDIQLAGDMDGIETAKIIHAQYDLPIIFVTANADDAHFNRAKESKPIAFISKPFKISDVQRAIELHFNQLSERPVAKNSSAYQLSDRLFVKHNDKRVKLLISDVTHVESDRNYCIIHTKDKSYMLAVTLKSMEARLPENHFVRVHRSYIVNQSAIDAVADGYVVVAGKDISVGESYRKELQQRLNLL